MENDKLAKLANYKKDGPSEVKSSLRKALETIVQALNLQNGSLKVYVHQGKPSPRIEIQTSISKEIEG